MKYKIDTRVRYVENCNHIKEDRRGAYYGENPDLFGVLGTIISIDGVGGRQRYGVEFFKSFAHGHSCNEKGKDGYCYYVGEEYIVPATIRIVDYEEML